ncbi:MAG: FAD-dependent oxidoreductase, partial [Thalassolituus sp.]
LELWPQLLDDLFECTGIRVRINRSGTVLVAHSADQPEMQNFERDLTRAGIYRSELVSPLSAAQLREAEPGLSTEFNGGYLLPSEAQIDNRSLLPALLTAAKKYGAECVFNSPLDITEDGIYRNGEPLQADLFIDCRGTGAGLNSGIRGVRGETLWVECPQVDIHRPVRLLHPRYHLYLVPRGNGIYQLGATELESDDKSPVSVRSAMEMLSAVWTLAPEFAEARILSMETNLRPASSNHRPVITMENRRLFINGLFRHGYLLAPALLEKLEREFGLPLDISTAPNNRYEYGEVFGKVCGEESAPEKAEALCPEH